MKRGSVLRSIPRFWRDLAAPMTIRGLAATSPRSADGWSANSEMPGLPFTFTVLNSPEVNAFALPGGYVYVTRGLVALANSEAELAAVIGHEIGHVVARHTAQRYSQAVAAGVGAALLGAVVGGDAQQLAQLGSELYLAGFSREQEFEADRTGRAVL